MRFLTIVTVLLPLARSSSADDSLPELVTAVEQNEAHYENLKLDLSTTYGIAEDVEVALDIQECLQSEERTLLILRGEQFRMETKAKSCMLLEDDSSEATDVFDGRHYRSFWQHSSVKADTDVLLRSNSFGQISDEPPSLTNLARPHMFLLEAGCPQVHLSTYMKGEEAVHAEPNPGYFPEGFRLEIQDHGPEEFQGLNCRRILIDTVTSETRYNGWELWLAEERNFIPVRNVAYTYRWSTDVPVAESVVDEWRELRPGVWFPMKAHTERYDSYAVSEGRRQQRWHREYEVNDVSLEPETTATAFTQLDFPPGTRVRVTENGKVVSP